MENGKVDMHILHNTKGTSSIHTDHLWKPGHQPVTTECNKSDNNKIEGKDFKAFCVHL